LPLEDLGRCNAVHLLIELLLLLLLIAISVSRLFPGMTFSQQPLVIIAAGLLRS